MLTINLFAQEQEHNNIIGFGAGYFTYKIVWIGDPINVWADINASPVLQAK